MSSKERSRGYWRPVGREIVADVEAEVGAEATDIIDVITATGMAETVTGLEASD